MPRRSLPILAIPVPTVPALTVSEGPRRLAFAIWLATLATVAFLSLHPSYGPPGAFQVDKLIHAAAYAFLAAMPFAAFRPGRLAIAAGSLMFPLGLALEALQGVIPGRSADAMDAVANAAGVMLGLALGPALRRIANRRSGNTMEVSE